MSALERGLLALLLAAGLIASAYGVGRWQGYSRGEAAAEAAQDAARRALQAKLDAAMSAASTAEAQRLVAQRARDELAQELEDAARQDPDAGRAALPAGSLQRLNRR